MHSKAYNISGGKIRLSRKHSSHTAAFSVIHASLEEMKSRLNDLHPKERAVSQNYKYNARKKSYLLGRFASRAALSLLMPKEKVSAVFVGNGVFSFPIVEGESGGLGISITHCDDIGLALVYPQAHPMAIDLEKVEAKKVETIVGQLTTKEQQLIRQAGLPKVIGFPMAWTIKESLSKVLKTGLMLDLKFMELEAIHRKENHYQTTFTNFGQYKAISYHIGDYVCSITLPKLTTPDLKKFEEAIKWVEDI